MSSVTSDNRPAEVDAALEAGRALVEEGRATEAVELLSNANRANPDADLERQLAVARYKAFRELTPASRYQSWPVPAETDGAEPHIPVIEPADLTADRLRRAVASHGGVHVPGLIDREAVDRFVHGIQTALDTREAMRETPYKEPTSSWFAGLPLPKDEAFSLGRNWIAGAGGVLACDSPRVLEQILSTYEQVGLRDVLAEYLGERPILSANKCTLRRVPVTANTDWHQDGAFLGKGIRAMNVWVALTDCGEGTGAPGMDLVPRRFEAVAETGTGGAIFDWAVGPDVVAELSKDHPVVRPHFAAGDAFLFDDLFLHRTAITDSMTVERFAIESWFFAATDYPEGQVPLVW